MLAAITTLVVARPAFAACGDILPAPVPSGAMRDITPHDLATLRDIGHPDAEDDETSPIAISPDGRHLSFVINRGDPDNNTICRALVIVALDGRSAPRVIDRGGELPLVKGVYRGMYVTTGFPDVVVPAWSPDGRWVGYLKRLQDRTQVWRAKTDGTGAEPITSAASDVEAFTWSADGQSVIYTSRPGVVIGERRLDTESRSGYLYDDRVSLDVTSRPSLKASDVPLVASVVDLASARVHVAGADERALLSPTAPAGNPVYRTTKSTDGDYAWTEPSGNNPLGPNRLWVTRRAGARTLCSNKACHGGILNIWWDAKARTLVFLRREGWNKEETALYRWTPDSGNIASILRTKDSLIGCTRTADLLLCGRENATTPRRLVAIDLSTGTDRLLFDPNPEFAHIRLGSVERLRWSNDRGLPAWGDLVLPPGYDGKSKLPMVVVVYFSRGFLRGGVGDEYPIFALAAKGFAVLSFERPPHIASILPNIRTFDDVNGAGRRDWAERRNILSAVTTGVDQVIARGIADPARVGLTGLSDGAANVAFALVNTRKFAAAAISTCCDEPVSDLALGGIAWADWNHTVMGYPRIVDDNRNFWKPFSLAQNAAALDTPLLMQLADREALLSIVTFTALRESNKPVELYVFPDEYHNKWQPAHRLAIYQRNIDWFSFWLQSVGSNAPSKRDQFARWDAMRRKRVAPSPTVVN
ncbi:Atxe2 family lasso peptide isopeptidase [Sphingomonas sp. UYP23]